MSFEEYISHCERLHRAGTDSEAENAAFGGLGGGCYDKHFDSWVREFGTNLHPLFFEEMVDAREEAVRSICEWLDLDSSPVVGFDYSVENKTEQYRSRRMQKVAVALNRRHERFFAQHLWAKRSLRQAYYVFNRSPTELAMPADARVRLRTFYQPHVERLQAQLATIGRTIPASWGYETP
jgi:hypothetical protein